MMLLVNFHYNDGTLHATGVQLLNRERSLFTHVTISFWEEATFNTVSLTDDGLIFYAGQPPEEKVLTRTVCVDSSQFAKRLQYIAEHNRTWRISWLQLARYALGGRRPDVLCTDLPYFIMTGEIGRMTLNELYQWVSDRSTDNQARGLYG